VRQAVEIVLVLAAQGEGVNPFPQQLGRRVANLFGMARIVDFFPQRFDQPELMIDFPQQQRAGMGSDSQRRRLNFDGPVEFRFKKSPLSFTHRVILPCPEIPWFCPSDAQDRAMVLFTH